MPSAAPSYFTSRCNERWPPDPWTRTHGSPLSPWSPHPWLCHSESNFLAARGCTITLLWSAFASWEPNLSACAIFSFCLRPNISPIATVRGEEASCLEGSSRCVVGHTQRCWTCSVCLLVCVLKISYEIAHRVFRSLGFMV